MYALYTILSVCSHCFCCRSKCRYVDIEEYFGCLIVQIINFWHPCRCSKENHEETNDIHHNTGFDLQITQVDSLFSGIVYLPCQSLE